MKPRLHFDFRYGFAVGRIRSLEKRFLSKQIFDRLLSCSLPQEMGRILSENGYRSEFSGAGTWLDIEDSLEREWNDTLSLVTQLNEDPFWTDLFRKRMDYYNLKILLKGNVSGENREDLLQEGGFILIELIKKKMQLEKREETEEKEEIEESEEDEVLPPFFKSAFQKAKEALSETKDPTLVELVVDQLEMEDWNLAFQKQSNRFLSDWLRLQIDLINLTTLLRIKSAKEKPPYLDRAFLKGGTLTCEFFSLFIEEPWKSVYQALEGTDYGEMVVRAVRDLENGKGFSEWERLCQSMNWQYLQFARQFGFGVEVLFSYLLVRETELSLVRRILIGRANGLAKETISDGVAYVFN
ncbi:V-type ATPase subunit [bacterium]|nr:V-type ATPase subunit [bacterium]